MQRNRILCFFSSSLFSLAAFNITLFPLVFVEGTSSHTGVSHTHTPCTLSPSMYSSYITLFPLVFVEGNCSHSAAPLRAPYTFEKKRVWYRINDTYNSHSFHPGARVSISPLSAWWECIKLWSVCDNFRTVRVCAKQLAEHNETCVAHVLTRNEYEWVHNRQGHAH